MVAAVGDHPMTLKSPCQTCFLRHADKGNTFCVKCPARWFYSQSIINWDGYNEAEQTIIIKRLRCLVPNPEQLKQFHDRTRHVQYHIKSVSKDTSRPIIRLKTFRRFYTTARRYGYRDIREWLDAKYMIGHEPSIYFAKAAGSSTVTFVRMLRIYGLPIPSVHNRPTKMKNLDAKRVISMLDKKVPMTVIANDQNCSLGVINVFKRRNGFGIKRYNIQGA